MHPELTSAIPGGACFALWKITCSNVLLLHIGCPVAVANLWDVTDRDIDRFSQAVLAKWLVEEDIAGLTASHPSIDGHSICVSTSVTNSRSACRLSSLIGAAPVCYGIPVAVSFSQCVS